MTLPTPAQAWPARRGRLLGMAGGGLVLALVAAGLGWWLRPPPLPPAPASLAVLALAYDGPPESAYLREVLPFSMVDLLRGVAGLDVAPFASSRTFAPQDDAKAVAEQLGVNHVLAGRLHVDGAVANLELVLRDGIEQRFRRQAATADLGREIEALTNEVLAALDRSPAPVRGPSRASRAYDRYVLGLRLLEGWDVERNVTRAIEAFTEALDADETFADAHAGLAKALWRRYLDTSEASLADRALAEAERAVELAPSLPEAHLALGTVLLGRARTAEAVAAFQRAQELAPADDDACRQIARAYAALKRPEEADRYYLRAIQLRSRYWQNYNVRGGFCLGAKRYAEAKEMYAKVIELRPLSWTGYSNKAGVHILLGEFAQAEELLRAALQLKAGVEVRTNLGFVLYAAGRYAEAAREYQAAVDAGAARAETYGSLGDAYRQIGRAAEARAAYGRAVELANARLKVNPDDAVLRSGVAMFLAGSGNCPEGARQAARATRGTGAEAEVHYYASVAYALCGDQARARASALRALSGGAVADLATNPDLARVREDPEVKAKLGATRR
jgi:tetratricopeptide (TPR) repeat protein